jgi:hypothetical protein
VPAHAAAGGAAAAALLPPPGLPPETDAPPRPPPPRPPPRSVGIALSAAVAAAGMGTDAARQAAFHEGRAMWSEKRLAQEKERYAAAALIATGASASAAQHHTVAVLARRLATQEHTRVVHAAAEQVAGLLKTPESFGQALIVGLGALEHVAVLNFDQGRITAAAESTRRQRRIVDKTASDIVAFIAERNELQSPARKQLCRPRRPPLIVVGNWLRGKTSRGFPMRKLIAKLARTVIFQYASECMSTSACNLCGDLNDYPKKQNGQEHSGSVQCVNPACVGKRSFFNRDTSAASGICKRWIYRYMLGGELGAGAVRVGVNG